MTQGERPALALVHRSGRRRSVVCGGGSVVTDAALLDSAPDGIDGLGLAFETVRRDRMHLISATTEQLVSRVAEAAGLANEKVLMHLSASPAVVRPD